jgi:hypothetical protein
MEILKKKGVKLLRSDDVQKFSLVFSELHHHFHHK